MLTLQAIVEIVEYCVGRGDLCLIGCTFDWLKIVRDIGFEDSTYSTLFNTIPGDYGNWIDLRKHPVVFVTQQHKPTSTELFRGMPYGQ